MNKFLFIIFLLLFLGCTKEDNNFKNNFILVDSLSLTNEVLEHVPFTSFHFKEIDGTKNLSFMEKDNIVGYNFNTDSVIFRIPLQSLDSMIIRDFLFHNIDSIFICEIHKRNNQMYVSLINDEGEVCNNWNITKNSLEFPDTYFYIDAKYLHPMVLIKDRLYIQGSYRIKPGNKLKFSASIETIIDLSNDSILYFGDLPQEYKNGEFFGNHQYDYSRTIDNKGQMAFSFPINSFLYIYDLDGNFIKDINCKSTYIDKIEPMPEDKYFELNAKMDTYAYSPQYNEIVYDKYRDRYIRLVAHKLDKYNEDGSRNKWYNRRWSMIILDNNFERINEYLLPKNTYSNHIIITNKGLMLRSIKTDNLYKCYTFKYIKDE